ncbi:MAG: DUF1844 domain-containing protein [Actinomycetota bacterium]|nr:DUF1844 domain-containing protein [Actinomycetota bacterium]
MSQDTKGNEKKNKSAGKKSSSRLWTPYSDPLEEKIKGRKDQTGESTQKEERETEQEISEEELRQRIEEAMERITVADLVIDMVATLSSIGYQKMGIPKEANEKYRDMNQAKLAIECIDALVKVLKETMPEDEILPMERMLDNLKLNFAKES